MLQTFWQRRRTGDSLRRSREQEQMAGLRQDAPALGLVGRRQDSTGDGASALRRTRVAREQRGSPSWGCHLEVLPGCGRTRRWRWQHVWNVRVHAAHTCPPEWPHPATPVRDARAKVSVPRGVRAHGRWRFMASVHLVVHLVVQVRRPRPTRHRGHADTLWLHTQAHGGHTGDAAAGLRGGGARGRLAADARHGARAQEHTRRGIL